MYKRLHTVNRMIANNVLGENRQEVFYTTVSSMSNRTMIYYLLDLTSENEVSGIIYSFLRWKQNIFLAMISTEFVVKCVARILKIG